MENTGRVLFDDDRPQWYLALGDRWIGPLSASDVYQKVVSQEIGWAHYVWKAGQPDWKRLCDVETFQAAVPALPSKGMQQQIKETSRPDVRAAQGQSSKASKSSPGAAVAAAAKEWFLYYNDSQFGPFSGEEISHFLRVGKLHGKVLIWRDGMAEWARLDSVEQFSADVAEAKKVREQKKKAQSPAPNAAASAASASSGKARGKAEPADQRSAPRRPLVARILMADQDTLAVAVCRDISVGGMQVLTDRIPGKPGTRIRLNVSPAGKGSQGTIEPFVAEGVIVRILEDGRGFSFRFDKLPESSRRVIENYIETAGS